MRNMQKMTKFISLSLIVALLLTPFSSCKTSAESNVDYTDEDVEELANVLEAIFEESVVYSDDGNFFGLDQDVLNDKVLNTEYAEIIDEFEEQDLIVDKSLTVIPNNREKLIIDKNFDEDVFTINVKRKENPKWTAARDKCFYAKMKDAYGPAAFTAIYTYLKNKDWTNAAKRLLKLGVKGSVPGLAATLMWSIASCGDVASKKHKRWL